MTEQTLPYGLTDEAVRWAVKDMAARRFSYQPFAIFPASARLNFADWNLSDAQQLVDLHADPRVTAELIDSPISSLEIAQSFIYLANALIRAQPGLGLWRCSERQTGQFIGFFSLVPTPIDAMIEIGVCIDPNAWGRGYALEGLRTLMDWAFLRYHQPELMARISPTNRVAHLLVKRLGFVDSGTFTNAKGIFEQRHVIDAAQWLGRSRRSTLISQKSALLNALSTSSL